MRRAPVGLALASLVLGCAAPEDPGPGVGEACTEDQSCAAGLSCVELVCRDDDGPKITIVLPEPSMSWPGDVLEVPLAATVEGLTADDRVEISMAPTTDAYAGQAAEVTGDQAEALLTFAAPLASGPYHLRAQISDGAGQPHPNPGAMDERVVFIRDATIPDTPQLAIVWPPAGYEHPVGLDLVIEVAVLPGSFELVDDYMDICTPLPDCAPAFGPECEAQCGPVIREGHVKIFLEPDYPDCLFAEPIGCNGNYVISMRPDLESIAVEGSTARGTVPGKALDELGPLTIHAALSYADHLPYPSAEAVIHESIAIDVVE